MKKSIQDYRKVHNWKWFCMLFTEYTIIFGMIASWIFFDNTFYTLLAIIIIGNRMEIVDEVVNHQALHYTLFSNRRWNELDILFLPFFTTFQSYQKIHLDHHIHVWKDKDIHTWLSQDVYKVINNPKNTMQNQMYKAYLFIVRPICWFFIPWTIKYILQQMNIFSWEKSKIQVCLFWFFVLYISFLWGFIWEVFLYWIIPFIYTRPIFFFYTAIAQHYKENSYWTYNFDGFVSQYVLSSYGEHLHWVHHHDMTIPCYNLKWFYRDYLHDTGGVSRKIDTFLDFKSIIFK